MTVEEHKFAHHPVRSERGLMLGEEQEYGGILKGELLDTDVPAFNMENSGSTGWRLYTLDGTEDYTPPVDSIAVILDVAVRDADGAATNAFVEIATPGIIYASKTQIVYAGDVNDRWQSRLVIAEMGRAHFGIAVKITGSVGGLDFQMKLLGWLIDPSVTRPSMPNEELKAIFEVNQ